MYNPRRYTGRCPKWQRLYTGPYLVVQRLGMVNLVVQKSRRSKRFVTHVDKLKRCLSTTPASWVTAEGLEIEEREGAVEPRVERMDGGGPRRATPRARRPDPRCLQERQEDEEMVGPVLIETVGSGGGYGRGAVSGTDDGDIGGVGRPRRDRRCPARFLE